MRAQRLSFLPTHDSPQFFPPESFHRLNHPAVHARRSDRTRHAQDQATLDQVALIWPGCCFKARLFRRTAAGLTGFTSLLQALSPWSGALHSVMPDSAMEMDPNSASLALERLVVDLSVSTATSTESERYIS